VVSTATFTLAVVAVEFVIGHLISHFDLFVQTLLCKLYAMAYAIGKPCLDVMDQVCAEERPVNYIHEGGRVLYIHPDECVDRGAGEPVSGPA
jgi:hypothetical protein